MEFAANLGCSTVWAFQAACVSGFSALYAGKLFSSIDPLTAAGAAGKTAGFSVAIGCLGASLYEAIWEENGKDEREKKMVVNFICTAAAMASVHLYERQFPLIGTISFTALGILGSEASGYFINKILGDTDSVLP